MGTETVKTVGGIRLVLFQNPFLMGKTVLKASRNHTVALPRGEETRTKKPRSL